MSNIQRYCETPYGVSTDEEGTFVEYDDHVAEVNRLEGIIKRNKQNLTERIEAEQAQNKRFQAKVEELEDEAEQYVYKTAMNELAVKQIKAEGIKERFHAIKNLMNGKGNDPFREGYLYALELFIEYAESLEKGDDCKEI